MQPDQGYFKWLRGVDWTKLRQEELLQERRVQEAKAHLDAVRKEQTRRQKEAQMKNQTRLDLE